MRAVVQRVKHASVAINDIQKAHIGNGLLILLGIEDADTRDDADWLAKKIANLRIFNDREGLMNLSLEDINGELLVVSQFTLYAQTKKGNRPSYIRASKPIIANQKYKLFCNLLALCSNKVVQTGEFGADMQIELLNDGPVTIIIDTKNKDF
jgi:D-tyrosyl-tRNA(Tyr) deacylase